MVSYQLPFFYCDRLSDCRPTSNPEGLSTVFINAGIGLPSYTPRHRVPILVPFYDLHGLQWDYSLPRSPNGDSWTFIPITLNGDISPLTSNSLYALRLRYTVLYREHLHCIPSVHGIIRELNLPCHQATIYLFLGP